MALDTDPLLGTELAGYRVEALLGRGGMGVVHLATDLRLERKVALKLVVPELAGDSRFRERFLRESRLAASLDHSHVVPVHAAGETDGQLWIAMRYVQGTDLRTLLEQDGPLDPTRALKLCSQVGEAVDAAHSIGLIHRDVKPANVLITEEGSSEHCYLTDFGLARSGTAEAGSEDAPHLSGTVDYTAPEQIEQEPAGPRADIYSLACVLYECLAGEAPFSRPRAMATLFAHAQEAPPSLHKRRPELPAEIDGVVAKALAKSPADRYQTCKEFCDAARAALGLAEPRLTRRRLLLVGVGAALVSAAAVAVPAILLGSGSDVPTAARPAAILPVTKESLVRIDPATNEAVAAIPLGTSPVGVAVGEGSVWVVDSDDQTLSRIDPERNEVMETVDLAYYGEEYDLPPSSVEAGEGAVWIDAGGVLRYDPVSGSLVAARTASGWFADPTNVAVGAGAVWTSACCVGNFRGVARLDPVEGTVAAWFSAKSLEADPGPIRSLYPFGVWVAVGEGAVWAASQTGRIGRIDPATNRVAETSQVSDTLYGIAAGEDGLWAMNSDEDSVLRVDSTTLQVTARVRVGRAPTALTAGAGAVWVTSIRDGTVTRIDPSTFDVKTISVGGRATDVAVGEGAVWVAVDLQ